MQRFTHNLTSAGWGIHVIKRGASIPRSGGISIGFSKKMDRPDVGWGELFHVGSTTQSHVKFRVAYKQGREGGGVLVGHSPTQEENLEAYGGGRNSDFRN